MLILFADLSEFILITHEVDVIDSDLISSVTVERPGKLGKLYFFF